MPRLADTSSVWRDLADVHRLEYPFPVNYSCYAVWGACLAITEPAGLLTAPVALAVLANLLLITSGLALNTAVDIRTDAEHRERGYLARAAQRFGRARLLRWTAAEMAAALALAVAISAWTGRWVATLAAVAAVTLHVFYNVEPVRLKRRGLAGTFVFCAALVVLPPLLSYSAVRAGFEPFLWPVLLGMCALAGGRLIWWSAPDVESDSATGMRTPNVRYGPVRALLLAYAIMAVGMVALLWGLWSRYGYLAAAAATAAHWIFVFGTLTLLRPVSRGVVPSSARMRRGSMSLAMVGDLLIVAVPVAAVG
ncbi:4-hydroxybenzoate polyprenyltransferase-like prenyltransferase [Saccharomonospora marina XMU15]|uniref:4-hydroxybenzoate polyprenyltransferase-like prenyltransferase n=1 Tax=Saccharomonospora marina XMU15 TaxID=882083 RepID=H5WXC5_9PSEU|nr:UbiA family prenyltransferase [Saccharomonospora marina]EHR49454.1 4-hydroxybenzoate polyprenyltransferase-like prenyltransferase [Saccharomonospora marina XMU15]